MKHAILTLLISTACTYGCAEDTVTLTWGRKGVKMNTNGIKGLTLSTEGHNATLRNDNTSDELTFVLPGKARDASLTYESNGKTPLVRDGLSLESMQGPALNIKCGKRSTLKLKKDTENALSVVADTLKKAVVWSKGDIKVKGQGSLTVKTSAVGCKGIRTKKDLVMKGGQVTVATSGNYLCEDTTQMDFPPMDFPPMDFGEMPPMPMAPMPEMMPEMPPMDFGEMGEMPPGPMRMRYEGTAKAIKALGTISVEGGSLTVQTATPGAEGIEGKQGVKLSGGNVSVTAYDDAINSGGKIEFLGAYVHATSLRNDAVDSNAWGEGAITIADGHVEVFSGAGPPEEGFDCDQWPILITGGEAISIGSGMGPEPSMPNAQTAFQPYRLFQNISIKQGQRLSIVDAEGNTVISTISTVDNPLVHSLVTSPKLEAGGAYEAVASEP